MITTMNVTPKAIRCVPSSFRVIFLCLIVQSVGMTATARAATVSWDGGGGNNSWQTAANWSGNVLPGANDDVVIDLPGDLTVVHTSGNTTVRSLNCQEGFQLLAGSLTVSAGASTIGGPLRLSVG